MKKITIKILANLIRVKSDYKLSEWDAEFIANELIRLNYCQEK